jgi:hypothetical protein
MSWLLLSTKRRSSGCLCGWRTGTALRKSESGEDDKQSEEADAGAIPAQAGPESNMQPAIGIE